MALAVLAGLALNWLMPLPFLPTAVPAGWLGAIVFAFALAAGRVGDLYHDPGPARTCPPACRPGPSCLERKFGDVYRRDNARIRRWL